MTGELPFALSTELLRVASQAGLEPATEVPVANATGQGGSDERVLYEHAVNFLTGEQAATDLFGALPLSYRKSLSGRESNPCPRLLRRSTRCLHHRSNLSSRSAPTSAHRRVAAGEPSKRDGLGASALRNLAHRDYAPAPQSEHNRQGLLSLHALLGRRSNSLLSPPALLTYVS